MGDAFITGTSIANGIEEALYLLSTSGPELLRGYGGNIIILTDGLEHNRPKINETILEKVEEAWPYLPPTRFEHALQTQ